MTLWRTRRTDDHLARRYTRRGLLAVVGVVGLAILVSLGLGYATTHVGRAVVPPNHLGVASRGRELPDRRRPPARGLVHPVAQRRRGDRVPRSQRPAEAGADARAPRLRRPALRPPRRGPQRGRAERVGLGWRRRHQGRDRLSPAPARRRSGPHRRHRPLRRRRADDRDRGRDRRARGRGVGGRRRPQHQGDHGSRRAGTVQVDARRGDGRGQDRRGRRVRQPGAAGQPQGAGREGRRAAAADRRPELAQRREAQPRLRAAAGDSATLWEIPESKHVGGLEARPAEYERRVVGFFDRALR